MLLDKDAVIATVVTHTNLLCIEKGSDTWKFAEQLIKAFESAESETAGSVSYEAHRPTEELEKSIIGTLAENGCTEKQSMAILEEIINHLKIYLE